MPTVTKNKRLSPSSPLPEPKAARISRSGRKLAATVASDLGVAALDPEAQHRSTPVVVSGGGGRLTRDLILRPNQVFARWLAEAGAPKERSLFDDLNTLGSALYLKRTPTPPADDDFRRTPTEMARRLRTVNATPEELTYYRTIVAQDFRSLEYSISDLRWLAAEDIAGNILKLERSNRTMSQPGYVHESRYTTRQQIMDDNRTMIAELQALQPLQEKLQKAYKAWAKVKSVWEPVPGQSAMLRLYSMDHPRHSPERALLDSMEAISRAFPGYEKGVAFFMMQGTKYPFGGKAKVEAVRAQLAIVEHLEQQLGPQAQPVRARQ